MPQSPASITRDASPHDAPSTLARLCGELGYTHGLVALVDADGCSLLADHPPGSLASRGHDARAFAASASRPHGDSTDPLAPLRPTPRGGERAARWRASHALACGRRIELELTGPQGTPPPDARGQALVDVSLAFLGADAAHRACAPDRIWASEQLNEIQRIAHVGSWEWEVGGSHITWTPELYRIYGLDPDGPQVAMETYRSLIHPEDEALSERVLAQTLETGQPFEFRHRIIRPDGEVRWLLGRGAVTHTVDGKPARLAGTAQDITNRQRAQQELEAMNAQLRAIVHDLPVAVLLTNADRRVVHANRELTNIFELGPDVGRLVGMHALALFDEAQAVVQDAPPWRAIIETVVAGDQRLQGARLRLRDGREIEYDHVPLPLAEGRKGHLWVYRDITARLDAEAERRKAAERLAEIERLAELNRLKTQLFSNATHELNTPLTPIKLQLHVLRSELPDLTPRQQKAFTLLERNMTRLAGLVQDVLDVGRIHSGAMQLQCAPQDLGALVTSAVESFEEEARRKGVTLVTTPAGTAVVSLDAKRITQVLYNLISNAIKFTPEGGRIHVRTRFLDGEVIVDVADSGAGLTEGQRARLFHPFSRVHEDGTPGTGLGLYISRGIVEQHGGELTCRSAGPGQGATFTMRVPVDLGEAMPASPDAGI